MLSRGRYVLGTHIAGSMPGRVDPDPPPFRRMIMAEILSDNTYNLLAILLSKLEGLEAYDTYLQDADGEARKLIEQISRDDERHAQMLRDEIEKMVKEGGLK